MEGIVFGPGPDSGSIDTGLPGTIVVVVRGGGLIVTVGALTTRRGVDVSSTGIQVSTCRATLGMGRRRGLGAVTGGRNVSGRTVDFSERRRARSKRRTKGLVGGHIGAARTSRLVGDRCPPHRLDCWGHK